MLTMSKMKKVSLGHVYLMVKVLASLLIQANGGHIKVHYLIHNYVADLAI